MPLWCGETLVPHLQPAAALEHALTDQARVCACTKEMTENEHNTEHPSSRHHTHACGAGAVELLATWTLKLNDVAVSLTAVVIDNQDVFV